MQIGELIAREMTGNNNQGGDESAESIIEQVRVVVINDKAKSGVGAA